MSDPLSILAALRRPGLLVRAARHGMADYNRARDLRRLMRTDRIPTPEHALGALIEEETALEATRTSGDASYQVTRHIDVLIALMSELRLVQRAA